MHRIGGCDAEREVSLPQEEIEFKLSEENRAGQKHEEKEQKEDNKEETSVNKEM